MLFIINKTIQKLTMLNLINDNEIEVYEYGLLIILNELITFVIVLFISFILDELLSSIIFLIVFSILRPYCGGYHAPSIGLCRTIFIILFVLYIVVYKNVYCRYLSIPTLLISWFIVPAEHPNNPISNSDRKHSATIAHQRMIILFIFESILKKHIISKMIGSSIIFVCILTILQHLINKQNGNTYLN